MNVRTQQGLLVLLALEALGGETSKREALDFLEREGLVALDDQALRMLETRDEVWWRNTLAHARRELCEQGFMASGKWNLWVMTPAGRAELDGLCEVARTSLARGEALKWLGPRARACLDARVGEDAPTADPAEFERRVQQLRRRTLARPAGQRSPKRVSVERGSVYERDPRVKAWVLQVSDGKCECCGAPAPFVTKDGPYLEVHHVVRLADGGPDLSENTVAVCPACHRELHYGLRAAERREALYGRVARLQRPPFTW